ncbi:AAA family ATPase [Streptomyces sp. 796.1]|uniref:AAA family ATPase n=1 Tax=Streptomyces sp. 796.1 TaxID=3163029 RepID=UPI0039C9A94C
MPHWTEWDPTTGHPYPGTENIADQIAADQKTEQINQLAESEKIRAIARRKGAEAAEQEEQQLRQIRTTQAQTITPRRVQWLWQERIPVGEVTLLVGRGGIGKSTLLATLTAWITTGDMRGEYAGHPKGVLYVVNEDSLEFTVVPRLVAAGADLTKVHFVHVDQAGQHDRVILPYDCDQLGAAAHQHHAAAVILDPLSSNLRAKSNSGDEVRPAVERIRRMAEAQQLAVIGNAHTRKALSTNLMDAIMGSSELGNVTRSVMGAMVDPDEPGTAVLSQEKNNLGRTDLPSYRYRIDSYVFPAAPGGDLIDTSRLEFLGKTDLRVSDMLADSVAFGDVRTATKDAQDFLRAFLEEKGGEALRKEVIQAARGEGLSQRAVERAASKLKLTSTRLGFGSASIWGLPHGQ